MDRNERPNTGKAMLTFRIVALICVMVLALLRLRGIWEQSLYLSTPLLSIVLLTQAVEEWNRNRKIAVFILCVAAFLWIVTGVVCFSTWFVG